jgi:putative hydrolase
MIYDFHTHTSLSDGTLSPMEAVRRAVAAGYSAVALTDHVGSGDMQRILSEVIETCRLAREYWPIQAIPGIELTHVPARAIAACAKKAKEMGAWIVVVHGETIVEPVEKGTDRAALLSPHVDILAHPGLITVEEARLAAEKGVYLEVSARQGHCLTNGHVAKLALAAGARLVVDSDAHDVSDLLSTDFAASIAQGAGLDENARVQALVANPQSLLQRILTRFTV